MEADACPYDGRKPTVPNPFRGFRTCTPCLDKAEAQAPKVVNFL